MGPTLKVKKGTVRKEVQGISNDLSELVKLQRKFSERSGKSKKISHETSEGHYDNNITQKVINGMIRDLRNRMEALPELVFPRKDDKNHVDTGVLTNFDKPVKFTNTLVNFLKNADLGKVIRDGKEYDLKKELASIAGISSRIIVTCLLRDYLVKHDCVALASINANKPPKEHLNNYYRADELMKKHFKSIFKTLEEEDRSRFGKEGIKEGDMRKNSRSNNPDVFTNQYHIFTPDCFVYSALTRITTKLVESIEVELPEHTIIIKYHKEVY